MHEEFNSLPDQSDWMDAPVSPLSDEQIKALAARQVEDIGWQPNEVLMTKDDSLAMQGETAAQALDALQKAAR